jgi:hypothetical protein
MPRPYLLTVILLLVATTATAGIYRWVDENGHTHFGERPPADAGGGDEVKIRGQAPASTPEPVDRKQQRDRYLEQRQRERAEKKAQAAKKRKQKDEMQKRCNYSRSKLREYQEHGSLYERLPNNERRYLTDREREQQLAKARKEVARWCK